MFVFERLLELLQEVEQQDELFSAVARCYKKTFDSLVATGFTEEQAIHIVAGQGISVTAS